MCPAAKKVCTPDGMGSYMCVPKCKGVLVECEGQCVDPATFDSADSCGTCDAKCPTSAPTCSPDGSGGHTCVLVCDDPLKACNGKCVDFNIDADNCGSCGNACPTGICQGGMCVGATPGNIVAACMDYQTATPGTPQTVLLGNAAFLPMRRPVRILAYTEYASPSTRAKSRPGHRLRRASDEHDVFDRRPGQVDESLGSAEHLQVRLVLDLRSDGRAHWAARDDRRGLAHELGARFVRRSGWHDPGLERWHERDGSVPDRFAAARRERANRGHRQHLVQSGAGSHGGSQRALAVPRAELFVHVHGQLAPGCGGRGERCAKRVSAHRPWSTA